MSKKHRLSKTAARRHRRRGLSAPWIALIGVLAVTAAIVLLVPKGVRAEEISVQQAHQMYEEGALLIDVRTQEEWDEVHIPGTVLIPLDELPDRLDEIPRERDIVVVCRSGNRSEEGAAILLKAGFKSVVGMDGGIKQWSAAGYPLEP